MSDHVDSFLSYSSRQKSLVFKIALFVIAIHLGGLGIGTFWNPSPPPPKPRSKVIVQTINLKPMIQSTTIENPSLSVNEPPPILANPPQEEFKTEPPLIAELLKEDIPPKVEPKQEEPSKIKNPQKEEPSNKAEELSKEKEEIPSKSEEKPKPTPQPEKPAALESSAKKETPQPKTPVQEVKKPTPAKKVEPAKKTVEPKNTEPKKKPTKTEAAKPKAADDVEKKRQQEKTEAEKKRQKEQAEAEKKRQQEKVEAEKKRQQEAEAEKKRQQELAVAQEAARKREQALLNKAKENLAKMSETRDKISTSSSSLNLAATELPKELTLQVDALPIGEVGGSGEWGTNEISYSGEVAARLKMALKLPDYGAVKIELTLDRSGKVIKVKTVHSESNKNKVYVESKVPALLFPSFGQRFQGESQKTFLLTLQNDS